MWLMQRVRDRDGRRGTASNSPSLYVGGGVLIEPRLRNGVSRACTQ